MPILYKSLKLKAKSIKPSRFTANIKNNINYYYPLSTIHYHFCKSLKLKAKSIKLARYTFFKKEATESLFLHFSLLIFNFSLSQTTIHYPLSLSPITKKGKS